MDFIEASTEEIARELLGKKLLFKCGEHWLGGYIVETEAYLGAVDRACHSYNWKRTPRIESMYGPGGTIYVYTMHTHNMLNIVTQKAGIPEAILIRALQPADHRDVMVSHRGVDGLGLSNGPGKLTKALGITRELDGMALGDGQLILDEAASLKPRGIVASPRIGIPNKGSWTDAPLRFFVEGNPYVSRMPKRAMREVADCWEE
ncbi:MAG: DNA-3-methyladenine glycosylase [Turicibacter sp.]|nr:DNA-3-methyladenine glycosylase [Turicibacter sp.]